MAVIGVAAAGATILAAAAAVMHRDDKHGPEIDRSIYRAGPAPVCTEDTLLG